MSRAGSRWVCCGMLAFGCASAPAPAPPPAPPPPPPKPAPLERWAASTESQGWPVVTPDWIDSAGHGDGSWQVRVRAPAAVVAIYRELGPGTVLPVGSVVVAGHRLAGDLPGPDLVMVKREEGWRFLRVRPDGWLDPSADLELCARCHREAAHDGLFGLPAGASTLGAATDGATAPAAAPDAGAAPPVPSAAALPAPPSAR